jgi:hypothetical protein
MRLAKTWVVAAKDPLIFKRKKCLLFSLIGFEIFNALGLPAIVKFAVIKNPTLPADLLPPLLNSFSFWLAIGAIFIPMAILMLLFVPLVSLLSIEMNVLISSRFNDIRSAQAFAMLLFLPFVGVCVLSEIGVFALTINNLFVLSAIVLILDVALFFATRATFQRDKILTRWK